MVETNQASCVSSSRRDITLMMHLPDFTLDSSSSPKLVMCLIYMNELLDAIGMKKTIPYYYNRQN